MPRRKTKFRNDFLYYVKNESKDETPVFRKDKDYKRFIKTLVYYQYTPIDLKLSYFLKTSSERQVEKLNELKLKSEKLVDILVYVVVPKGFYTILRQKSIGGISKYLSLLLNSYTKYFNHKYTGSTNIFLDQFFAKKIPDQKILKNLSRYLHRLPLKEGNVGNIKSLVDYQWSSYWDYKNPQVDSFIERETILSSYPVEGGYIDFINSEDSLKNF